MSTGTKQWGDCEIILDDTRELEFVVSDMENTGKVRYSMSLPGLPDGPAKRLDCIHLEFTAADECRIDVTDMGFGDLYPSSNLTWHETMKSRGQKNERIYFVSGKTGKTALLY